MSGIIHQLEKLSLRGLLLVAALWVGNIFTSGSFYNDFFFVLIAVFGFWFFLVQIQYIAMKSSGTPASATSLDEQAKALAQKWVAEFEQKYG